MYNYHIYLHKKYFLHKQLKFAVFKDHIKTTFSVNNIFNKSKREKGELCKIFTLQNI